MLFGLIVAILAGVAARPLERQVTDLLARWLGEDDMPDAAGRRVASFGATLLLAALVLEFSGSGASPVILMLGGLAGYFQAELRRALLSRG